ncbi:MAG TPA: hypothetical protein VEO53_15860, partial [Candidatus Binatia bacterium]|nr:hypothetical protein [Candidatus Binatia bacterium]
MPDKPYQLAFEDALVYGLWVTDKAKLKKQEADALAAPVERAEDLGRASGPATQETRLWLKSLEYVVESILSQQGSD